MQPPTTSLCLQLHSALQQPFPGISNSGFGLSLVPGEIWPLRFTSILVFPLLVTTSPSSRAGCSTATAMFWETAKQLQPAKPQREHFGAIALSV